MKRIDIFGLIFNLFVKVNYLDIKKVIMLNPIKSNGKPALHGTGNLWNYFPSGLKPNFNEKIFILERKNKSWKIGFTLDRWSDFVSVLEKNGIYLSETDNEVE